jgi:tRNA 2-thiocytidine biosynthesis protein TtcA
MVSYTDIPLRDRPVTSKLRNREYFISKKVGKAIFDYNMIADGDKIAVAVSGGKDSLSLLRILSGRRAFVPISYDLVAVYIDLGYPWTQTKELEEYFIENGYNYQIQKVDISPQEVNPPLVRDLLSDSREQISCFWCAWNRRKAIFETADRLGCNKVAFGHHKDDIIQTILLNLFFQGEISTMSPKQELFGGKLTVIRPLAYIEEKELVQFASTLNAPLSKCSCPNSLTSKRTEVKQIISNLEKICPHIKTNIFKAVKRIKKDYLL